MEKALINKIFNTLDGQQKELTALLRDLIRIQSYSGQEKEIVEFIVSVMKSSGFEQAGHDQLGNAVGRIGNGPVKILYDAHIDTVVVTDNEQWQYPPFEGKIIDGIIYGRGAVDEKPAMAGFLTAVRVLSQVVDELPFTLYVIGSVMEEDCDGYPLLHLIEKENIRPDYVVLGEPTDLRVYRGQRGRMEMEIMTEGKSAHGAHNRQGINAIYKMMPLIQEIEKLDQELAEIEPLGKGSLTVSEISSNAPSLCSVPDRCRIHIDRRLTTGETREHAVDQLRKIISHLQPDAHLEVPEYQGQSWTGHKFKQEAYFPTWLTAEDHPLVRAAVASAADCGAQTGSGFWQFSTNGVATAGRLNIPTIGFAPGREELAHTAREELNLGDLLTATKFYALFPFYLLKTLAETNRD